MDYRQRYAVLTKNKSLWQRQRPDLPDMSGIYILTRKENNFKYCYVGQSKHMLTRLAEHLMGYQHIDLSLKKHGIYSEDNPTGWKCEDYILCFESELDLIETEYIDIYANEYGFQMLNKTGGSQGVGKFSLDMQRERKGYNQGVEYGYNKARKEVKYWFDKYLQATTIKDNKLSNRMLERFYDFIGE